MIAESDMLAAMEAAWNEVARGDNSPKYMLLLCRRPRAKRGPQVCITEAERVDLGMPAATYPINAFWTDVCWVDARCLKRYRRRSRARIKN